MLENMLGYREKIDFEWEDSEVRKNWPHYVREVMDKLWEIYPRREEGVDHPFVPWRNVILPRAARAFSDEGAKPPPSPMLIHAPGERDESSEVPLLEGARPGGRDFVLWRGNARER